MEMGCFQVILDKGWRFMGYTIGELNKVPQEVRILPKVP